MFEYDCPHCLETLLGSFGEDVYCSNCDKTYETDWDYVIGDSMVAWLTGVEFEGVIND